MNNSDMHAKHQASATPSQLLSASDFEVVAIALAMSPDLRLVALGLKRSRQLGLSYPIESVNQLVRILGDAKEVNFEGHSITEDSFRAHILVSDFPIASEQQLAMVLHLAQHRCRHRAELANALRAFESQLRAESVGREV